MTAPARPPRKIRPHPLTSCGRVTSGDPQYYPHIEYQGQVIYFCTEACLEAFRRDPQRFYQAHSKGKEL
ncbi:MAG: YHS domain-containing protein [Chloroflexi bacterium]|nr:YHS domain-containing protein [Chloroflexota bacterium]